MALLTIRLASAGCQADLTRIQSAKLLDKRRLVAELEILHITTAWLLTSENNTLTIGHEPLSPDEVLGIQSSLGSAAKEVALYLRGQYDEAQGEVTANIDAVLTSAVKFVGGWLGEGGGESDEESLGLLEVFLALSSSKDIEMVTWCMLGIKGMILYTDDGGDELLANKVQLWPFLDFVMEYLSLAAIETEIMVMLREICSVFRFMVETQPLMVSEDVVRSFPAKLFDRLPSGNIDDVTWEAQTEGALLSLEIMLKIAEHDQGHLDRQTQSLMERWALRIRELMRREGHSETKEDLAFLASALENLSI
jgi:hypothetical protein